MSSGYGFNGGSSRCFGEWQRFLECYTNADTSHPVQCTPQVDDYFECLHHKKEKARVMAIKSQSLKNKFEEKKSGEEVKSIAVTKDSLPEALGLIDSK